MSLTFPVYQMPTENRLSGGARLMEPDLRPGAAPGSADGAGRRKAGRPRRDVTTVMRGSPFERRASGAQKVL